MEEKRGIICPNCGMMNDEGDLFCGNCGTRLDQAAQHMSSQASVGAVSHIAATSSASSGTGIDPAKGQSHATASLVLGIIAVVCWFFGYSAIISVVCGFIGLTLAGKSKEEGFEGGSRTAGFVLSLIGLIGGAVVLIACVACVGSLGMLGASFY